MFSFAFGFQQKPEKLTFFLEESKDFQLCLLIMKKKLKNKSVLVVPRLETKELAKCGISALCDIIIQKQHF